MRIVLLIALIALVVLGGLRIAGSGAKHPAQNTVKVVAAGEDLPPGCKLGFTNLHYIQLPEGYMGDDMYTSYRQLVGSTTSNFVRKGEPITARALLPLKHALAESLGAEFRAVTLKLDPDALVDNAIEPGDRVDVLVTVVKDSKRFTRTVCQNLEVLLSTPREMLLADRFRGGDSGKITLSASPDDSERLTEALESGRLRLILRNRANSRLSGVAGATESDVLPAAALKSEAVSPPPAPISWRESLPATLAPPPVPAPLAETPPTGSPDAVRWVVEVISGSKKESCEVPSN